MNPISFRQRALAITLAVLGCAGAACADPAYPPPPTPSPQLAPTEAVLGHWDCTGVMPAGAVIPGAPATPYRSSHVFTKLLGGFGYQIDYRQDIEGPHPFHMEGREYLGWDAGRNRIVYFWIDTMGTAAQGTSEGWKNGELVLTGVGALPAPGAGGKMVERPAGVRDIYALRDGHLTWQGLIKPEGAKDWIVIGNDKCTRAP